MIQGLYAALSAITSGSTRQDVTANNIANVNSSGFKTSISVLGELKQGGAQVLSVSQNDQTGYLINTGQPLDLAINGDGYFRVEGNEGFDYTRNGAFRQDADGNLVDTNGRVLIELPEGTEEISIAADGTVSSEGNTLGTISTYNPENGSPVNTANYEVLSGFLEGSNVDITKEIVDSMVNLRYVQANTQSITTVDEMMGTIIDMKS